MRIEIATFIILIVLGGALAIPVGLSYNDKEVCFTRTNEDKLIYVTASGLSGMIYTINTSSPNLVLKEVRQYGNQTQFVFLAKTYKLGTYRENITLCLEVNDSSGNVLKPCVVAPVKYRVEESCGKSKTFWFVILAILIVLLADDVLKKTKGRIN